MTSQHLFQDCRRMGRWLTRLLAETAWPPASDAWLKDLTG
jgi:hypothetical protein